jgi:hypothetical protein
MAITFDRDFNGIVFGFDLSFRDKSIMIWFIFWGITLKIK